MTIKSRFCFLALPIVAMALIFGSSAKADILFEPMLGYNFDSMNVDLNTGNSAKFTSTGPTIGLKLAYAFPIVYVGVLYDYGMLNSSVSSQPAGYGFSGGGETRSSLFAIVGVKVPLLQFYVGYGIIDDWDFKSGSLANSTDVTMHGPGAIKIGAGFTGLPIVAINLEYTMTTFNNETDTQSQGLGSSNTLGFKDATGSSIMLNVSAPFHF